MRHQVMCESIQVIRMLSHFGQVIFPTTCGRELIKFIQIATMRALAWKQILCPSAPVATNLIRTVKIMPLDEAYHALP